MIPGRLECAELLDAHGVPEHIREHSRQVARLSLKLGRWLAKAGESKLDNQLLESAGLLHDVAKLKCIEEGGDHAKVGAQILRRAGFDEVAALVERHVELGEWSEENPVTGEEVLFYADKRVMHERVVSLDARFEDLLERWGSVSEGALRRVEGLWRVCERLEAKIFARVGRRPEELE